MKKAPRNPVARAMRLAGKSSVAHGKNHKQQRRNDRVALQRAVRAGREVFRSVPERRAPKDLPTVPGALRSGA